MKSNNILLEFKILPTTKLFQFKLNNNFLSIKNCKVIEKIKQIFKMKLLHSVILKL